MDSVRTETPRRFWRKLAVQFVLGAIAGAGAVVVLDQMVGEADFGNAHPFGLVIGALLLYMGLALLIASASPARAAKVMGQTLEPGEDFTAEARSVRLQALVTLLAGVELLVLSWRTDLLWGLTLDLLVVALIGLVAVQTWLNYRVWRRGDEFFRRVLVESAVISFVAFQFVLFAVAAAARLGGVEEPSALDMYVWLMAIYLIAGFVVGVRRGIGVPQR